MFETIRRWLKERRVHPSAHTNWALYGLSENLQTATGRVITEDAAYKLTIVYACIQCLAVTVGSLPFFVYKKVTEDSREKATDHYLYRILHEEPNPEMVSLVFRETMMNHLAGWGNFYAHIAFDGNDRINSLWPLSPKEIKMERINGELFYRYTLPSGEERILPRREVFHIPGWGFDGLKGYSPITMNRESIALTQAAEEFGSRFFANDARPGIVLSHPGNLSEPAQDRLRKSWEKLHVGLENKHRLAILEEGMDIKTIGIPPGDAQWIELRSLQIDEIARIFRIPPPIVGILTHATFSNVEELARHFGMLTIRPWCERIEAVSNVRFFSQEERGVYYTKHLMDSLMRADITSRYAAYATGRQWGFLSINDIRRMEDMNPVDMGDIYLSPINMIPLDQVGKAPPPPPKEPFGFGRSESRSATDEEIAAALDRVKERHDLERDFEPLLKTTIARFVNRENIVLEKAIKKHISERNLDTFRSFMDQFYSDFPNYIKEAYGPAIRAYASAIQGASAREVGDPDAENININDFIDNYLTVFIEDHVRSSRNQLDEIIRNTDKEKQFEELARRVSEWSETRVDKISSDQTVRLSNAVANSVFFFSAAVSFLVWITRGAEPCPFCQKMNGKVVHKKHFFVKDGIEAKRGFLKVYGKKRFPPIHQGCICSVTSIGVR
ncbi:MAG: phage portal protein [Pseudomonadota bacterium]